MRIIKFSILIIVIVIVGALISQSKKTNQNNPPATTVHPTAVITIDAGKTGEKEPLQGFLTGIKDANFNHELVRALQPRFWRIPDWKYYDFIKEFNPRITLNVGEQYANDKGGWNKARPWENWKEWETALQNAVRFSTSTNRPIAYWDIWGEPDIEGGTPWNGSYSQLLEAFARGARAIRAVDPTAKIIGPSTSEFDPRFHEGSEEVTGIQRFITDLARIHTIKLDAISWHELGSFPEEVPTHAASLREFLKKEFPGYAPEFHINEFSAEADHLIPGWTVGWLYYLEKANISVATRACWSVKEKSIFKKNWSDCWTGLNSLFLEDTQTPQPLYWVHRAYAELVGMRIQSESTESKTIALASRDDNKKTITILAGRYEYRSLEAEAPPQNVTLIIKGYPYQTKNVNVAVKRIGRENIPGALPQGPTFVEEKTISLVNKTLTLPIEIFRDGEVYSILITPAQ